MPGNIEGLIIPYDVKPSVRLRNDASSFPSAEASTMHLSVVSRSKTAQGAAMAKPSIQSLRQPISVSYPFSIMTSIQ